MRVAIKILRPDYVNTKREKSEGTEHFVPEIVGIGILRCCLVETAHGSKAANMQERERCAKGGDELGQNICKVLGINAKALEQIKP